MEYSKIVSMNPIVLAFIGDATYERKVRLKMIEKFPNDKINALHKKVVKFAKAKNQAFVLHALKEEDFLTDEEMYFVKRGRNSQSSVPKNANVNDYRHATGFEAMIGYLELVNDFDRIDKIVNFAVEKLVEEN